MGLVYAEIELINQGDLAMSSRNLLDINEVKRMPATVRIDSRCFTLGINEDIRNLLQLPFVERSGYRFAREEATEYDIVGPVQIRFKNKNSVCYAIVLPDSTELLLGSIPLLDMNLLIDPLRQELIENPRLSRI